MRWKKRRKEKTKGWRDGKSGDCNKSKGIVDEEGKKQHVWQNQESKAEKNEKEEKPGTTNERKKRGGGGGQQQQQENRLAEKTVPTKKPAIGNAAERNRTSGAEECEEKQV